MSPITSFGSRVRVARERVLMPSGKRMTQGQLAKLVGVKRNTVSRWENSGVSPRDPVRIGKLSEALRVPVEYLLQDGEDSLVPRDVGPGDSVVRDAPSRVPYGASVGESRAVAISFPPLVPPKVYEVIHDYAKRLERAQVAVGPLEEAMRILWRAASTPLRSSAAKDRTVAEMMADIESAWAFVSAVLRRDGRAV